MPFLLFAWAERHISSSLASVYNATTPLMTMAVAMLVLPSEPRTCDKTLGLMLGFVGVILVLAPWNGLGHSGLAGQLACLGATACYGMGFTYLRRFVTPLALPSVSVAAVQVSLAAVVMLALTPIAATGAT
ncbi:DMT family transporter [Dermacoccus barathri]|uniref:DMT family transporter n=1 Tax=Dermacoccus barathri TaxID=322601 RepID=UPI0031F760A8